MRSPHTTTKSSHHSRQLEKAHTQQRTPNTDKNKFFKKSLLFQSLSREMSEMNPEGDRNVPNYDLVTIKLRKVKNLYNHMYKPLYS